MTQIARILEVLSDGDWHDVAEIHERAGYSRLNSRVAEARSRGLVIECERLKGVDDKTRAYRYRLLDERHEPQGSAVSEAADPSPLVALVEHDGGQYALDIGAAA